MSQFLRPPLSLYFIFLHLLSSSRQFRLSLYPPLTNICLSFSHSISVSVLLILLQLVPISLACIHISNPPFILYVILGDISFGTNQIALVAYTSLFRFGSIAKYFNITTFLHRRMPIYEVSRPSSPTAS